MTSPNFTIQKIFLELELDETQEYEALQQGEAFKRLFVESILPRLEDLLKEYENNDTIIRINKLDISLDDVHLSAADPDQAGTLTALYETFEKKITAALGELPLLSSGMIEPGITGSASNITRSPGKTPGKIPLLSPGITEPGATGSTSDIAGSAGKTPGEIPLSSPGITEPGTTGYTSDITGSPGNTDGNFSVLSSIEQQTDTFIFYLKHGYLPWNIRITDFPDLVELLKELLSRAPDYFRRQLITLSDLQQAVKRLVLQFPAALIHQVLMLLSPELVSELEFLSAVAKPGSIGAASRTLPSILSEATIKHALKTVNQSHKQESIREAILKEAALIANTDVSFLKKALETDFPGDPGEVKDAGETKRIKEAKELKNKADLQDEEERQRAKRLEQLKNKADLQDGKAIEKESEHTENSAIPAERPTIAEDPDLLETDGVYVTNAGLILAWPYLQLFFKELGVYTENGLEDKEKAMHLLHYLCFGSEQDWEYALFLNKIVCGWEPGEPPGRKIVLSEKEKEECDQLIEAIVRNWSALKNTSVDGFREAFLQRNGIISRINDNWLLRIEQKGYDIMLEQLEWGINTIQLSWNEYTLFVEW